MKKRPKKWLLPVVIVLMVILAFCAWIYGWGGSSINMMDFSANEVERIVISCTDTQVGVHSSIITEKDDIQALINSVNTFRHTGNEIKLILKMGGIGGGGSVLYEFDVYLLNGKNFQMCFASNNGEQEWADMEVSYWIYEPGKSSLANTCRGSMEVFYELYEKYDITE